MGDDKIWTRDVFSPTGEENLSTRTFFSCLVMVESQPEDAWDPRLRLSGEGWESGITAEGVSQESDSDCVRCGSKGSISTEIV